MIFEVRSAVSRDLPRFRTVARRPIFADSRGGTRSAVVGTRLISKRPGNGFRSSSHTFTLAVAYVNERISLRQR